MTTSALTYIIAAIEARLVALGFAMTEDVFDFDQVPDSVINKACRITTRRIGIDYYSGNLANPKDEITIWIAYVAEGGMSVRTVEKAAIDDRQYIENDLLKAASIRALASDPLLIFEGDEASTRGVGGCYVVSKVSIRVDYQWIIA
jgi:hypothetical protein